jgi:CRP-like cAMP-binding protein
VFGELAALEWARGFGYPRLAAVIATEPSELLVFPDGALNVLMRRLPSVRDQITTVVQERLPQA